MIPPPTVRETLNSAGIRIIYASIEISHDDDPSWILSRYDDLTDRSAALFQVDVMPEYANAWEILRDETPDYADEFHLEDLNQLGIDNAIIASLNVTPGNVTEIISSLPALQGITLTLADNVTRADVHVIRYEAALDVLRALPDLLD